MVAKKKPTKKTPAKRAQAKAKGKGKRYTDEQKAEIVAFAKAQGRGGQTAAAKKFGASPLSVGQWVKKAGGGNAKKAAKTDSRAVSKGGSIYARIGALATEIEGMEGALASKKAELKKINAQL